MGESKYNRLDDILSGLEGSFSLEKSVTKTVSIRLPVIDLARIDAMAGMKDISRNVLLNDVIDAAMSELMDKLAEKNPDLAQQLDSHASELAKKLLLEGDAHPPHKGPRGPKHKKKHVS